METIYQNYHLLKKLLLIFLVMSFILICHAQFAGGEGTEENPWRVETPEHLNNIRNYLGEEHTDKFFVQISDINLGVPPWNENEGWQPLGTSEAASFRGTYNGGEYIISNLTINRNENYQGLFGYSYGALLRNVGLTNVEVRGGQDVAGLAGYARDTDIIDSFVSGDIFGVNQVGGITGYLHGDDYSVVGCYTTGSVTGTDENSLIGGIAGRTISSDVINCYSKMSIRGKQRHIGGLVGRKFFGSIVNCYSIGSVSATDDEPSDIGGLTGNCQAFNVENSYWNTLTSGQPSSASGIPRTTEEMRFPYAGNTYVNWDFDETWVEDTERINEGYPYLNHHYIDQDDPLDTPEVTIEIIIIDDIENVRLSWEGVEGSNSYIIFSSEDPFLDEEDWVEIDVIVDNEFIQPVDEEVMKYYFVKASADEAP